MLVKWGYTRDLISEPLKARSVAKVTTLNPYLGGAWIAHHMQQAPRQHE